MPKPKSKAGDPPSAAQRILLRAIDSFARENGIPPTFRDLAGLCGYSSPNAVNQMVKKLETKGYVTHKPGLARSIRVVKPLGES